MKASAPFLLAKTFLSDAISKRSQLKSGLVRLINARSYSYPIGQLPICNIFELIPDADDRPVVFQNIFELPIYPADLKGDKHFTASTTLADTYILALLCQKVARKAIIEVGTSCGETSLTFALNSPEDCVIHTLDIQDYKDNPSVGSKWRGRPQEAKIKPYVASLKEIESSFQPKSVDMIFIDGDHRYAGVMEDTQVAIRLIRPGGVIVWHDYTFTFRDDVVRALDEINASGALKIQKVAYANISVAFAP